jgi:hypothetical protein
MVPGQFKKQEEVTMLCYKCPHFGKYEGQLWEKTPCAKCVLKNERSHTCEPGEGIGDPETEEATHGEPYEGLTGSDDDPMIPLSVLGTAMACWVSLTLQAREVFKLRMNNKSLSEIAKVLGISKVAVFYVLDRAIKENPVMASIASGCQEHRKGRKRTSLKLRRK